MAFVTARADLPFWEQTVVSASAIEAALFRAMELPGAHVLYPRPPAEATAAVGKLLSAQPGDAPLYALRAHAEEQALDFAAAERDWTAFAAHAADKGAAERQLADFYGRRLNGPAEVAALEAAAKAQAAAAQAFLPANEQAAWHDFERALAVVDRQALGDDAQLGVYSAWIARFPVEPAVRAREIVALLRMKRLADASAAIEAYRHAFPQDTGFVVKASAVVAAEAGGPDAAAHALAVFDAAYQPLWPADLSRSYFDLLQATHTEHTMLANARAALERQPDDLAAATRLFRYFRQAGRPDAAANVLAEYRASKEARQAGWTADELYTLGTLLTETGLPEEAARYDFALGNAPGKLSLSTEPKEQLALAGTVGLLLDDADRPMALGSGNLSIYRDLATVDTGPGYWNGVLSLWLNSTSPANEFSTEETKATPYFHRAKAAELLSVLDARFPAAPERPALHAALIRAYGSYGEDPAVIAAGTQFLANFPKAQQHLDIALLVADADARAGRTEAEFALYDKLLAALAAELHGMPLTAGDSAAAAAVPDRAAGPSTDGFAANLEPGQAAAAPSLSPAELLLQSLEQPVLPPATAAPAAAYRQVLDRYLGRLAATDQLPRALGVLRGELDRNPDDPRMYERLADFLAQNDMFAQQEQVYGQAIARFNAPGPYNRLARLYLRQKRREDFAALTRKVTDIFSGSELEGYFANVDRTWPQLYLQLNLYAHARFPHDLRFTRNLLTAYSTRETHDAAARATLLREHWWEAPDLQSEFFEDLSKSHAMPAEVAQLERIAAPAGTGEVDQAATRELAELQLWQSHFEQSAPLLRELAQAYPADAALGDEAASVFRSLAYHDPAQIAPAVAIERNLAAAEPRNLDRLAAMGDTYANSTSPELNLSPAAQLAQADPYWRRMSAVQPGDRNGYLQSATVFWDYFQFGKALGQIQAARRQFHEPTLYGFEAGALDEDMGKPASAIDEYARAAAASLPASDEGVADTEQDEGDPAVPIDDSTALGRLLVLAQRPATAPVADSATAKLLAETHSLGALELRVDVLRAQRRSTEIGPAVASAIGGAGTADDLAQLAAFSARQHLPAAYVLALEREVALAADPVERIEFQDQLVAAFDRQGDTAAAQRVVETVYREQPRILGVVRSTVSFYSAHKQPERAISILKQAAGVANPGLARDFTLEAVAKSSASGDSTGARSLLQPLLAADPFNAQYIALEADSFAQAQDNAGLRDFYAGKLAAVQAAPLAVAEKRAKIALLREGLIPALTALKDPAGATDQYIALLRAFPEDANLVQQAALYARRYSREPQLLAFLNQAVAESPRDSRFAVDLARADELLDDPAGALAAYSHAIAIRKDRPDLYTARARLEEHRQDFDAACADYARLFTLSYNDPQWMEKAALARARQGRRDQAVQALVAAWITDRPVTPTNFFRVAAQLEQWNFLAEAQSFAERGVDAAGDDLLAKSMYADGVNTYVTVLTRQGEAKQALDRLLGWARSAGASTEPAVAASASGPEAQDARELRAHARALLAKAELRAALHAISSTVATFGTPEAKLAYAQLLDGYRREASPEDVEWGWIPAAHDAGLLDLEAAWRRELLLSDDHERAQAQLQPYTQLQQRRMDFAALAGTLDSYAALQPATPVRVGSPQPSPRAAILGTAVEAWRNAGEPAPELRDLRILVLILNQTQWQDRYFALLLRTDPAGLIAAAAANGPASDAAANYAFAHGGAQLGYAAIAARARSYPPVWDTANVALAGLYFRNTSDRTDAAFRAALDDTTLGERLAHPPDDQRMLTGDLWFALASRYGVYRTLVAGADAEAFLPAELERSGAPAEAYLRLARTYVAAGERDAALLEFRHALELDPADPTANIAIAEQLWAEGQRDQAIAAWGAAIGQLRRAVDAVAVPESFWTGFHAIVGDVRDHGLNAQLDPGLTDVLERYIHKNDTYRTAELLQDAFLSQKKMGEQAAAAYVLRLVGNAPSQRALLAELSYNTWYPRAQLGPVYERELELAKAAQPPAVGNAGGDGEGEYDPVDALRSSYLGWLLERGDDAKAEQVLDGLTATKRADAEFEPYSVELAAKQKRLPALIARWTADPEHAPDLSLLSQSAAQLRARKDAAASRLLLEFVFARRFSEHTLAAADYLALAQDRLATGDTPGALDLLHRYVDQADDFYAALDNAGALLARGGDNADAVPFLEKLADSTPWDGSARLRLGQTLRAAGDGARAAQTLTAVAASPETPYALRAQAAESLRSLPGAHLLPEAELRLVAAPVPPSATAASQPYFTYARLAAAAAAPPAEAAGLLKAALAVGPEPLLHRLQLAVFYADLAAGRDAGASAAVQPLLSRFPELLQTPLDEASRTEPPQLSAMCMTGFCPAPQPSLPPEFATRDERLKLLHGLATLDDRLRDAGAELQVLHSLEQASSGAEQAAFKAQIARLQQASEVEAEDAACRPVIQASLEDSRHVCPRVLPARDAPGTREEVRP